MRTLVSALLATCVFASAVAKPMPAQCRYTFEPIRPFAIRTRDSCRFAFYVGRALALWRAQCTPG